MTMDENKMQNITSSTSFVDLSSELQTKITSYVKSFVTQEKYDELTQKNELDAFLKSIEQEYQNLQAHVENPENKNTDEWVLHDLRANETRLQLVLIELENPNLAIRRIFARHAFSEISPLKEFIVEAACSFPQIVNYVLSHKRTLRILDRKSILTMLKNMLEKSQPIEASILQSETFLQHLERIGSQNAVEILVQLANHSEEISHCILVTPRILNIPKLSKPRASLEQQIKDIVKEFENTKTVRLSN